MEELSSFTGNTCAQMNDLNTIHCPSCGMSLEVAVGSHIACPGCGQHIALDMAPPPVVQVIKAPPPLPPPPDPQWISYAIWLLRAGVAGGVAIAALAAYWLIFSGGDVWMEGVATVVWVGIVILYFVPGLIANRRRHPNAGSIGILNIFLGWTFIGWVAALVWACSSFHPRPMLTR